MFEQYFTINIGKMQKDGSIKTVDFKVMDVGDTYSFVESILNRKEVDFSDWNSFFNGEIPQICDNESFIYIYDFDNYIYNLKEDYKKKLSIAEKGKTLVQITRQGIKESKFNIEDTKENRKKLIEEYILNHGDGVKLGDLRKFINGYIKKISGVKFTEISLVSYEEYKARLEEELMKEVMELEYKKVDKKENLCYTVDS